MTKIQVHVIYGAGYGGRTLDSFVSVLREYGIEVLADVRTFPISRHFPQFSKNILSKVLRSVGISYRHEGRRIGGKLQNVGCEEAIDELSEMAKRGTKICLLCAESDPERCHRTTVLKPAFAKRKVELIEINFPKIKK